MKVTEVEIVYKTKVKHSEMEQICASDAAYRILKPFYDPVMDYREMSYLVLLNKANRLLGVHKLSEGGTSGTVVDVRMIFQVALKTNASAIIISHNHPSGTLKPSDADCRLTNKILEAGKILEIPLLDHIILTSEGYYSFGDDGKI